MVILARILTLSIHGILLGLLRQRIDEPAILHLIGQWLAVGFIHSEVPDDEPPPDSPIGTMLRRGGEFIHEVLKTPLDPVPVARDDLDLYSPALVQPRSGLSAELLAALSLVQPAFAIARRLVPLVQRIGVRRLALGGALAAGTVALSELIYRIQADTGCAFATWNVAGWTTLAVADQYLSASI